MAVSTNRDVADGLFTPYHQRQRAEGNGLVGTLSVNAEATGAAGGGSVTIILRMRRREFGFPILWVPTLIQCQDNLGTPEPVTLNYLSAGNRQLTANLTEVITPIDAGDVQDVGHALNVSMPIEGNETSIDSILSMKWETNTDTKIYHMHVFGPVYDLQVVARQGYIDELMAGLR